MACFLIPAAEAVVTTIATKALSSHEKKAENAEKTEGEMPAKMSFSAKLKWLDGMLWGGSALLAFEHIWHGEIIPVFPFLTNAADPASTAEMLREMGTAGVGMAALVTAVWGVMVGISRVIEKRSEKTEADVK